jgi:hypothetical protein
MSSNTDIKEFSFCYGSDSCENIKVSQSIVDFITENIINTQKSVKSENISPEKTEKTEKSDK